MARRGTLKCPKCDRTFSMPAHLGRHMAAVHGARSARGGAPRGRAPGRPRVVTVGPLDLLASVRSWRNELAGRQAHLADQITAVDALLNSLGETAAPRAGRRPAPGPRRGRGRPAAREGSLKSFIARVLQQAGRPMRVVEITDAVLKAGFKTRNRTLAKTVGNALPQMTTVAKVDRGLFKAK